MALKNHTTNQGDMDTRITLLVPVFGKNNSGATTKTYTAHSHPFAAITDYQANVEEKDNIIASLPTTEAMIYNVRELTDRWRVRIDGRDYEILSSRRERLRPFTFLRLKRIEGNAN